MVPFRIGLYFSTPAVNRACGLGVLNQFMVLWAVSNSQAWYWGMATKAIAPIPPGQALMPLNDPVEIYNFLIGYPFKPRRKFLGALAFSKILNHASGLQLTPFSKSWMPSCFFFFLLVWPFIILRSFFTLKNSYLTLFLWLVLKWRQQSLVNPAFHFDIIFLCDDDPVSMENQGNLMICFLQMILGKYRV